VMGAEARSWHPHDTYALRVTAPEDWWLHDVKRGHWTRAVDVGFVRVGASSKGKKTLVMCQACGKARFQQVVSQPPGWTPPTGSTQPI
jgi:hypothetical protein